VEVGVERSERDVEVVKSPEPTLQSSKNERYAPDGFGSHFRYEVGKVAELSNPDAEAVEPLGARTAPGPLAGPGDPAVTGRRLLREESAQSFGGATRRWAGDERADLREQAALPLRPQEGAQQLAPRAGVVPKAHQESQNAGRFFRVVRFLGVPGEQRDRHVLVAHPSDQAGEASRAGNEQLKLRRVSLRQDLGPHAQAPDQPTHVAMEVVEERSRRVRSPDDRVDGPVDRVEHLNELSPESERRGR